MEKWKPIEGVLLGRPQDGDEDEAGQKSENRKVLEQAPIARPFILPVFRVESAVMMRGEFPEEAQGLLNLDELLFGLLMAGVVLPDDSHIGDR